MRESDDKPRRPAKPEWKDYSRRYLVRTGISVREIEAESVGHALYGIDRGEARLMGTHETRIQAIKRLGWAP